MNIQKGDLIKLNIIIDKSSIMHFFGISRDEIFNVYQVKDRAVYIITVPQREWGYANDYFFKVDKYGNKI